jgi:acyl dehydratase
MSLNIEALSAIGQDLGRSEWLTITQEMITDFGRVTLDGDDPMHNDPVWAKEQGPFGGIVSYGFLTLSLLTYFSHQITKHELLKYALNYGFDRVRIISPVPVGSRIRGHFVVGDVARRSDGGWQTKINVTVEIEGQEKPALTAEWLSISYQN